MSLFEELKRRNVFKVAVAYIVTAWLLMQVADLVLENIGTPPWVMQTVLLLLAIGFPIALIFAWAFEVTPEGIKRERDVDRSESITQVTGRKLDFAIIAMLVVVAGYFIWESRFQERSEPQVASAEPAEEKAVPAATDGAATFDDTSIAVLPFVNLSSDPEQEFFSDGISEELLNVLAQYPDLRVAARTSSFQFKDDNRDISEIARLLKVNHVLEGSVRKSGTRLRITAQLIEADNGYHLWSETYDRELNDVFAIQDEISAAIGSALRSKLKLDEESLQSAPRVAESRNTAAYEAFLHGRHLINERGNRAITEAVRYLQKSLRLDPSYAPAHAHLAIAYFLLSNNPSSYGDLTDAEVISKATPHIEQAEQLDPDFAELWGAKAQLSFIQGKMEQGIEYLNRALELNPVYVDAMNWRHNAANGLGDFALAAETILALLEVDPYSIVGRLNYINSHLAYTDRVAAHEMASEITKRNAWAGNAAHALIDNEYGDVSESVRWSLLAYREDPMDRLTNSVLAQGLSAVGMLDEALRISATTEPFALWAAGDYEAAASSADDLLEKDPGNVGFRMVTASLQYLTGDFEAALENYERALEGVELETYIDNWFSVGHDLRYAYLLQVNGRGEDAEVKLSNAREVLRNKNGTALKVSARSFYDGGIVEMLSGNRDGAIENLTRSTKASAFISEYNEPIFEPLYVDEAFQRILEERETTLERERAETLDLICNNNPIPDAWQPLEQTCAEFETAGL